MTLCVLRNFLLMIFKQFNLAVLDTPLEALATCGPE
jgi:hypothetical protein